MNLRLDASRQRRLLLSRFVLAVDENFGRLHFGHRRRRRQRVVDASHGTPTAIVAPFVLVHLIVELAEDVIDLVVEGFLLLLVMSLTAEVIVIALSSVSGRRRRRILRGRRRRSWYRPRLDRRLEVINAAGHVKLADHAVQKVEAAPNVVPIKINKVVFKLSLFLYDFKREKFDSFVFECQKNARKWRQFLENFLHIKFIFSGRRFAYH